MTERFLISETPLEGMRVLKRLSRIDERGWFERLFCPDALRDAGWRRPVAQINRTLTTTPGTLRGMHFQHPPHAEMKLVSCLRGEVLDIAVDIRIGSPTFLQWHAEVLSGENHVSLLIPEGFAHGFQTLSPDVEMLYLHTAPHVPDAEDGLRPDDPALAIPWPLAFTDISVRDLGHPLIGQDFAGIATS